MTDDTAGEMAVHYALAQRSMDSVKSYADRGRQFAAISDDSLGAKYVSVIEAWARDPFNVAAKAEQSDLTAEYTLRGQEPPYDAVAGDLDKIFKAASEFLRWLPQEGQEEIVEPMVIDYLLAKRNRS